MEIYEQWLKTSFDDLRSAKKLFEVGIPIKTTAVYHAQQCAEKSLKSFLIFKNQPLSKTHDLEILTTFCKNFESSFGEIIDKTLFLNSYSIAFRYPGSDEEPSDEETEQAIEYAEFIYYFVIKTIKETI